MRPVVLAALLTACGSSEDSSYAPPDGVITEVSTDTGTTTTTTTTTTTGTATGTGTTSFAMGPNDAIAQLGCDLLAGTLQDITAVDDQVDAGQVVITPRTDASWMVTLPGATQGFFTLEIGEWATTQAFFAYEDNSYGVWVVDGDTQYPRMINGACPNDGITDQRIYFDHWTPATLRFETNGPRAAWFAVVKES